jgi:hypothetical protein
METAVRHDGRVVGRMDGQTFVRSVDPERHMLRKPAGWAHDDALLDRLERAGCTSVRIEDRTGGGSWFAPLAVIRSNGIPVHRPGWPPQTVLVLADWATLSIRPATADDVAAMLQAVGGAS